jgi:hypothetical protein
MRDPQVRMRRRYAEVDQSRNRTGKCNRDETTRPSFHPRHLVLRARRKTSRF